MKIIISVLGLVQVALLLSSIGFLWTSVALYLNGRLGEFRTFGIGFLVSFGIFAVLLFSGLYWNPKRIELKTEVKEQESSRPKCYKCFKTIEADEGCFACLDCGIVVCEECGKRWKGDESIALMTCPGDQSSAIMWFEGKKEDVNP